MANDSLSQSLLSPNYTIRKPKTSKTQHVYLHVYFIANLLAKMMDLWYTSCTNNTET